MVIVGSATEPTITQVSFDFGTGGLNLHSKLVLGVLDSGWDETQLSIQMTSQAGTPPKRAHQVKAKGAGECER